MANRICFVAARQLPSNPPDEWSPDWINGAAARRITSTSAATSLCFLAALTLAGIAPVLAQAPESDERPSIESLLKDGWQVAGYTSAVDGYSAFILFRHPVNSISSNAVRGTT